MLKNAFNVALKAREQEINLYWTRANYFMTAFATLGGSAVVVAVLGATLFKGWIIYPILYVIEWIGVVLAVAWLYVNRGSKYWQVNWEKYVDALGKDIIGPLFNFHTEEVGCDRRYSVSKINKIISLYILDIWIMALFMTIILWCRSGFSAVLDCVALLSGLFGLVVAVASICAIYRITHAFGGQDDTRGGDKMIQAYLRELDSYAIHPSPDLTGTADLRDKELHYKTNHRPGCLWMIFHLKRLGDTMF